MRYDSLEQIKEAVADHGGVLTLNMGELRDAYGADRLGSHIREGIEGEFGELGLAHRPRRLTNCQEDTVRLYLPKSPVGKLLEAASRRGESSDNVLRRLANGEAERKLRQMTELLSSNGNASDD